MRDCTGHANAVRADGRTGQDNGKGTESCARTHSPGVSLACARVMDKKDCPTLDHAMGFDMNILGP
jgi:hypothetical protein